MSETSVLSSLVARLEGGVAPGDEIDRAIASACEVIWSADEDGQFGGYGILPKRVRFTRSIDSAMTLVPDGWLPWVESDHAGDGIDWAVGLGHMAYDAIDPVHSPSLPIAICIASLKARECLLTT